MAPRTRLEAFKFGLYLVTPFSLYTFVAYYPEGLDYFVKKFGYVVYPPTGPEGIAHRSDKEASDS